MFLTNATGYVANPNAMSAYGYCTYKVGDGYLANLGFSWDDRWMELGFFACFMGVNNLVILALAARFLNYAKP